MTNIDASREIADEFKPKFTGTKAASVTVSPSPLAAPPLDDEDEFVAMNEGQTVAVAEVLDEQMEKVGGTAALLKERARSGQWNNAVAVNYTGAGRVTMWKPTPDGWMPRPVDRNAIKQLRMEGWQSKCGDCGGLHGGDVNDCPKRPKVSFGQCPVCGIRIHDSYQKLPVALKAEEDAADDPNLLIFDDLDDSTPKSRVHQAIVTHMWYKHPRSSSERNISAPAEPPVELIANMVARRG